MKRYGFNLKHQELLDGIEDNERFEENMYLNKVLLSGDPSVVERYYKEEISKFHNKYEQSTKKASFWHNVGPKNARVFFGLVKMINDAFVRMITSGGIKVTVVETGEGENAEEKAHEENTKRLKNILDKNKFYDQKWGLLESFQSGFGYGSFKCSIDETIVDVPIIETIQPEKLEVETKRGFVTAYIYKTRKTVNNVVYELHEVYTKEPESKAVIVEYRLYREEEGEMVRIKISELDDHTTEALGLDILKVGNKVVDIDRTMAELTDIPVLLKNNTAYNSWFPQSPFGEADTQGS